MCLALEHDLLDLACTTATLDALSGSRFILGVGAGWNADELKNHRPEGGRDPSQVSITLFAWGGESERMLESYAALGVDRTVFAPPDFSLHSASATLKRLDELRKYIERH